MPLFTFPKLVLRLIKGSRLSHLETDANFTRIKEFCQSLASIITNAFKPDGSLQDNVVGTDQLQDRSVTQRKLHPVSTFTAEDTGGVNAFKVTFTPTLAAYEDRMVFYVKAATENTGASTLQVDSLAAIEINKNGTVDLEAGDIKAGQLFAVAYFSGTFRLLDGVARASVDDNDDSNAVNFTGVTRYTSDETDIPAVDTSLDFTHGLAEAPENYNVSLVCIVGDAVFDVGQRVPVTDLTDGAGQPSFASIIDAVNITVRRNTVNVFDGGEASLQLDLTKWKLVVSASIVFNETTNIFPALTFSVKEPEGGFSYGNGLFMFQYGRNNSGKVYTHKISLVNNNLRLLSPASSGPNHRYCNIALFRFTSGDDYAIYTSSTGVFKLPMEDQGSGWKPELELPATDGFTYKPVWIVESGGDLDEVYAATSGYQSTGTVGGVILKKINTSSNVTYGSALNLTSATIKNADASAGNAEFRTWHQTGSAAKILLFQYNKYKKRIYVVTNEVSMLHIFKLVDTSGYTDPASFIEWWNDAGRLAKLQYEKTIGIPGSGDEWRTLDSSAERSLNMTIEWDLTTGEEKAIVLLRQGMYFLSGSITRVPWKE